MRHHVPVPRQQFHTHLLGAKVTPFNPAAQVYAQGIQGAMMAHGADPSTAAQQSYVAIWGMVQRQAAMAAFIDTFRAMALVFLLVLPLLLLMREAEAPSRPDGDALSPETYETLRLAAY